MKNTKKRLTIGLLLFLLAFIWGQSAMSRAVSRAESEAVGSFLAPLLELLVGRGNVTDHLVRKLAHFCEYAALGAVLAMLLRFTEGRSLFFGSYAALCGMAVAVVDESIQLLADGRGAQVQDVLLDTGGMLFGLGLMTLLLTLRSRRRHRQDGAHSDSEAE